MELYIWPSEFGLPSIDPKCLQFMISSFLRYFHLIDFVFSVLVNIAFLQDVTLDSELTVAQRSEFDAYSSLMLQDFYPALIHLLWLDQWNYEVVTSQLYLNMLFFPYGIYYLEKRRKRMKAFVEAGEQSEKCILLNAMSAVTLLSAKLGDNKYFYGDKPSSLDALVFGYLAPIMKMPLPSDRLQLHLLSFANLVRFVESIISIYLPLTEDQLRQQALSRVSILFLFYFVPVRDTVLFAVAAVTLSLLFAVHTGLISFQLDDDIEETD
uniref:GST_C_6 domain-containing protein n=1 Tax=Syphacia muris TaxID=451379 RepID=A0A0N5ASM4_9BILA